jgi:hypothetical protein
MLGKGSKLIPEENNANKQWGERLLCSRKEGYSWLGFSAC